MSEVNNNTVAEDIWKTPHVQTDTYIIAYLDMLGSKERIENDPNGEHLNAINSLYSVTLEFINSWCKGTNLPGVKVKIFSDNIVIAKKISKDSASIPDSYCHVALFVALIQITAFIHAKWLIRGCISIGDLYIDDTLIWGKALVRAHNLEESIAIYPRVIIDQKLLRMMLITSEEERKNYFINIDVDGMFYLGYLEIIRATSKEIITDSGEQLISEYEKKLQTLKPSNEKIWQKYYWTANYFSKVTNNPDFLEKCPNLKIPET